MNYVNSSATDFCDYDDYLSLKVQFKLTTMVVTCDGAEKEFMLPDTSWTKIISTYEIMRSKSPAFATYSTLKQCTEKFITNLSNVDLLDLNTVINFSVAPM